MRKLAERNPKSAATDPQAARPVAAKRHVVRTAVRWIATIGLLSWLALSTNWHAVGVAFSTASIPWLFAAAAIYVASQVASVARWGLLVRAGGISAQRSRLLGAYFEGMFVNVCLPTTVGGDVLKVLRIGGSNQKRIAAATVVADRGAGLLALFALLGIGLLLKLDESLRTIVWTLTAAAAIAALVAAVWVTRLLPTLMTAGGVKNESVLLRTARRVWLIVPVIIRPLIGRTPWVRVLSWAVVVQGLNVAAVVVAGRAIGIVVPLAAILVATTTVSLAAALPISIAGVGIREVSLPLLLAADGVPRDLAVALGIVWSAIVLAVGLVGGPAHFAAQRRAAIGESPATGLKDRAA